MDASTLHLDPVSQHKLRELCKLTNARPEIVVAAAIAALFVEPELTIMRFIADVSVESTQRSGGASTKDSMRY